MAGSSGSRPGAAPVAFGGWLVVASYDGSVRGYVTAYDAMGMKDLRDDAKRVLDRNYPNSAIVRNKGPLIVLWGALVAAGAQIVSFMGLAAATVSSPFRIVSGALSQ